ncbi:MAG: GTP-binding protein [Candidatus Heimdallarchaeota archaeon]|nr:GTP-binding protein [Candidatus Heimdallarchaeota archaeon]MBY8993562.1 GTP-binding protein [Candidatus Heimdallarchaeota archaeon]
MATFFKVVVLGDGGIGKTSICNYLTTGEFFGSYKLSIGADFFSKKLTVDGEEVTLQICDIGGQDQFAEISNIFTKGAHGCILCYDTTRRDTLDSLDRWLGKLEDNSIPKVLVSTKNDVEDLQEVIDEEGIETARRLNIPFFIPTTSLKGIGITETFEAICKLMLLNKRGMTMPVTEMVDVTLETQLEVHTISGSQHMQAQPLGIGRVPSEANHLEAPIAPVIEPVKEEYTPPVVEPTEAEPSFTQPISLAPPVVEEQTEERILSTPREIIGIEPPTEPEKTATQPITTITPPISEQMTNDEESKEEDSSSFLYRLRQERKKREDEE